MTTVAQLLAAPFAPVSAFISAHAREQPQQLALIDGVRTLTYAQLDALIDRAAAALQRDGVGNHGVVALCAATSIEYVALFIATLRVGAAACPLAPSASAEQLAAMVRDCAAHVLFLDQSVSAALDTIAEKLEVRHIAVPDAAHPSLESLDTWLAESGAQPAEVDVQPDQPFENFGRDIARGEIGGGAQVQGGGVGVNAKNHRAFAGRLCHLPGPQATGGGEGTQP